MSVATWAQAPGAGRDDRPDNTEEEDDSYSLL